MGCSNALQLSREREGCLTHLCRFCQPECKYAGYLARTHRLKPVKKGAGSPASYSLQFSVSSKTDSKQYLTCEGEGFIWRAYLRYLIESSCALTVRSWTIAFQGAVAAAVWTKCYPCQVVFKASSTLEAIGNSFKKKSCSGMGLA